MGNPETFSLRLREARERKKLTQKQLAELAGITAASVSAYEKLDSAKSPSMEIAIQLAKALGVSLDWLAGIGDIQGGKENNEIIDIEKIERPLQDYLILITLLSEVGGLWWDGQAESYSISFHDSAIVKFCSNLDRMQGLLKDGVIERDSFYDWINGHLRKFEDYYVSKDGSVSDVADDMPF